MPRLRPRRRTAAALAVGALTGSLHAGALGVGPAHADGFGEPGFATPSEAQAGGVKTAATRSGRFALPIGEIGALPDLAAVRLFRSADGGVSWAEAGTFPPGSARLLHEEPRDGDYWFAVRGLDRRGAAHPAGTLRPTFRVTVDATPPRLSLRGWWADENRVRVALRAEDGHLVRDSVTLRYLPADPAAGWTTLTPAPDEATSREGLVSIELNRSIDSPFDLTFRASARDEAGNEATATLPLPRPRTATERPDDPAPLTFTTRPPGAPAGAPARFPAASFAAPAPPPRLPAPRFPVATFAAPAAEPRPEPASVFPVARFVLPPGAAVEPPAATNADWSRAPAEAPAEAPPESLPDGGAFPLFPEMSRRGAARAVQSEQFRHGVAGADPATRPIALASGQAPFDPFGAGASDRPASPRPAVLPAATRPAAGTADPAGDVHRLYERLLEADPGDRDLRLVYAERLIADGRRAAAARQYRALLRIDPQDAEALRRLTGLLAPVDSGARIRDERTGNERVRNGRIGGDR